MKTSRFNVFVDNTEEIIIYNTLRGSITKVNKTLASILKEKTLELPADLTRILQEQGIICNQDFDELEEYEKMHLRWKEGKENVEVNILLTYDCNFECPYCYQGRGEKGEEIHGFKYMSNELLESIKKFIKKTVTEREAKKLEIVLYGGEPSLPKAINMGREVTDEMSTWAVDNGLEFSLHILSNGSLLNKEIIEWLSSYNARLQIPVDGDPEMHNKYRYYKENKKGSFDDIAEVLKMTKGTNIETHIRISLTDETYPTMENLLNELKERELNHVYPDFCYITAFTEACDDFKEHTLSDFKLFKIMPELWIKAHKRGFPLDIRPQVQPLPCSSVADGSYIIDPFGEVYKCWELVGLKEHSVGKIDIEGNLEKTKVYGEVLKRNPVNIPQCREHSFLPACAGGCVCKAQWQSKSYQAPGCGTEKYLLKDKIKVYISTLDLSKKQVMWFGDLQLQIIEGVQEPKMSHCYVLV